LHDGEHRPKRRADILCNRRETPVHGRLVGDWSAGADTQPEFYYKLGKFDTWAACMRTIDQVPNVHAPGSTEGPTYATVYAPLEKTPFDPHVVLIVGKPRMMLKLAQACLYKMGGRLDCSMAGIQSVCADTVAQPYMTGKVNFSMGCDGSRKFSGIEDDEMVAGIPGELIAEVAEAIKIVTGAPGSV
jgi:uncharacterized protein (DUF169 family)